MRQEEALPPPLDWDVVHLSESRIPLSAFAGPKQSAGQISIIGVDQCLPGVAAARRFAFEAFTHEPIRHQ